MPTFIVGPNLFFSSLGLSISGMLVIQVMAGGGGRHSFFIGSHGTVELMEIPSWQEKPILNATGRPLVSGEGCFHQGRVLPILQ